jgi:hypothetical protein
MKSKILGLLAVGLLAGPLTARAAALFSFIETGGNVVGTLSGSINLTNAVSEGVNLIYGAGLLVQNDVVFPGTILQASDVDFSWRGTFWRVSGPTTFGGTGNVSSNGTLSNPGVFELVTYASGARLGLLSNYSGQALVNTLTFTNRSFSSLGVTAGDYVYTLAGSGDTVTIRFQRTAVPEPGTLALLGLGLAGLGLSRRRNAN